MSTVVAAGAAQQKLPLRTKLAYGLGTLSFGIKDQGFGALLMLYYNQVVGLPAAWVGTAIMVAMLVDAFADPLIGHLSDHYNSSLGRRHPFMYASAVPVAASYLLLWTPPQAVPLWQCAYLVLTAIAVRVSVSLFEVPNAALLTEFTGDYEERTSLSTWRGVFLAIGLALMGLLTFKYFLKPTADGGAGQLNQAGYIAYSRVAAVVMFSAVLLSSWGTQARGRALAGRSVADRVSLRSFAQGLREVMLDRVYASLFWTCFFFALAVGVNGTIGVYLMTYFWRISSSQIGTITASSALALVLAVIVLALTRRFDKKRMALLLLLATIVSCVLPQLLGMVGVMSPTSPSLMAYLIAQNIAVITSILTLTILATSMAADVGDHFRLKGGQHIEGLMFSTLIMINKAVSGVGVAIAGALLSLVGFPDKAQPGQVGEPVVFSLGWVYIGGIVVLCTFSLLCLRTFPLTRAAHGAIVARLREEAA